jgi:hypothetical protein
MLKTSIKKIGLTAGFTCVLTASAMAASTTSLNTSSTSTTSNKKSIFEKINFILVGSVSSNTYKYGSLSNDTGSTIVALGNTTLSNGMGLTVNAVGVKALTGDKDSEIVAMGATLSKGKAYSILGVSGSLKLSTSQALSESAKKSSFLINSTTLSTGFGKKLTDTISISYGLGLRKYFYEYDKSRSGNSNTNYSIKNSLGLSYSVSDKVGISLGASANNSWNLLGRGKATVVTLSQSISYQATKSLGLDVGLETGQALIDYEQGNDSEIELIDSENTSISASATYSF